MVISWPLNSYHYAHKLKHFSHHYRSFGGNWYRDPQMTNMYRKRDCRVLSSKWNIYLTFFLPRFRDYCRRGMGKWLLEPQGIDIYSELVITGHHRSLHTRAHCDLDCTHNIRIRSRNILDEVLHFSGKLLITGGEFCAASERLYMP